MNAKGNGMLGPCAQLDGLDDHPQVSMAIGLETLASEGPRWACTGGEEAHPACLLTVEGRVHSADARNSPGPGRDVVWRGGGALKGAVPRENLPSPENYKRI